MLYSGSGSKPNLQNYSLGHEDMSDDIAARLATAGPVGEFTSSSPHNAQGDFYSSLCLFVCQGETGQGFLTIKLQSITSGGSTSSLLV